jgi:uncharacterized cupredoxin-like copper-binding protein
MTTARLAAILLAAALAASGCGGDDGGGSSTSSTSTTTSTTPADEATSAADPGPTGAEVEIGLKEWAVIVEAPSVGAGEVRFKAVNEGKVPHELVVLKTDTKAGDLKVEGAVAKVEGTKLGTVPHLGPKASGEVAVDLEAGHYVLLCNLPGHFQQGMRTDLDVK